MNTSAPDNTKSSRDDNAFYRDHYHQVLMVLVGILLIVFIAIGFVFYQMLHRPLPVFYAKDVNNQTMELNAFNAPNRLPETILRWATKAAISAYTFDFVNYNRQIAAVKPYFTESGWNDYQQSVQGLIETIVQNKLFINGVVSGAPVISNEGPLPGIDYAWRVQIPFLVTYQSANITTKRDFYVALTIIHVPTSVNPQGIGIDQFVMVPR